MHFSSIYCVKLYINTYISVLAALFTIPNNATTSVSPAYSNSCDISPVYYILYANVKMGVHSILHGLIVHIHDLLT